MDISVSLVGPFSRCSEVKRDCRVVFISEMSEFGNG